MCITSCALCMAGPHRETAAHGTEMKVLNRREGPFRGLLALTRAFIDFRQVFTVQPAGGGEGSDYGRWPYLRTGTGNVCTRVPLVCTGRFLYCTVFLFCTHVRMHAYRYIVLWRYHPWGLNEISMACFYAWRNHYIRHYSVNFGTHNVVLKVLNPGRP